MAIAGLVMTVAATPSDAARKPLRMKSNPYDGLWSVSIQTQGGPCDPSYRYPARIVGGTLEQVDTDFSYQLSGTVLGSGAIAVMVSQGGQTATGYGRLHGATGAGRWSTSGNQCFGVWSAVRRG
jgi:hypothetical protein